MRVLTAARAAGGRAARTAGAAHARRRVARGVADLRLAVHPADRSPVGAGARAARGASKAAAPRPQDVLGVFDGGRAFELLRSQCELGPRVPGTAGHAAARALFLDLLRASADEVTTQHWTQRVERGVAAGQVLPMTNVLARVRGSGRRSGSVMLATHWDSRPVADADPEPALRSTPVVGASDGASGVAVLLHLAEVLAARRPPVDVVLALFDGEDLGEHFYGSRVFARSLRGPAAPWRPAAAVVVDMIGGSGLRCATELGSVRRHPELWAAVHACAEALGQGDAFGGPAHTVNDDHTALSRAGVPSILLIDAGYEAWHTTHDTPERCSAASLQVVGRVLQCWVEKA